MTTSKRICLWSSPRNLSTALMYSFAQRPDTKAIDEPLYAHYLRTTPANHPGRDEVLLSQENDGNKVVAQIISEDFEKPVVFCKQMTHHLVNLDLTFLQYTDNIIFIRDPKQIISSYAQVVADVSMDDVGIEKQFYLSTYLSEHNIPFVVLDAGELLHNAEKVLEELCKRLSIPFYRQMLSWPAGAKKEDGVWAKYWYDNVHRSTHFEKQETSNRSLPAYLEPLYLQCKEFYDKLSPFSIKA